MPRNLPHHLFQRLTPATTAPRSATQSQSAANQLHRATRLAMLSAVICTAVILSSCTVITVTGAAVGIAATATSAAVDVAVGTARVGAKVGSKAVGLVVGDE